MKSLITLSAAVILALNSDPDRIISFAAVSLVFAMGMGQRWEENYEEYRRRREKNIIGKWKYEKEEQKKTTGEDEIILNKFFV